MSKVWAALAAAGVVLCAGSARGDAFFTESDFGPGTWEDGGGFSHEPGAPGIFEVEHQRFVTPDPENAFLLTQITIASPDPDWGGRTPIWMNDFTYTPSEQGAIETISGSVTEIFVRDDHPDHRGSVLFFVEQDDKVFYLLAGFSETTPVEGFNQPGTVASFSQSSTFYFTELLPNGEIDMSSEPDFSETGTQMRFGFGWSMNDPIVGQDRLSRTTFERGLDDVTVRITSVPAPAALVCLMGAGAFAARRRR